MIIKRIACGEWEKPNGEIMSQDDWDNVPIDLIHRAYAMESPLDIGGKKIRRKKI